VFLAQNIEVNLILFDS